MPMDFPNSFFILNIQTHVILNMYTVLVPTSESEIETNINADKKIGTRIHTIKITNCRNRKIAYSNQKLIDSNKMLNVIY